MSTANNTAHGRLTTTEGVVSVSVGGNRYMDAAVVERVAGIELSVDEARVTIGPRPDDRRADLTLCLDMDRHTMERLTFLLVEKLGLPAFNEREWLEIRTAIDAHLIAAKPHPHETLVKVSNAITEAYGADER